VVRLSRESEQRDALNILAADRRELALTLSTKRPLRKPQNPKQRKAIAQLREEASAQIARQLAHPARRVFRGRVALELRLRVPDEPPPPALATMVKDYIDLLVGSVVVDDSRVDHLLVLGEPADDDRAKASLRCLPLSIFAAEYDRAFRVLGERGAVASVTRGLEAPTARFVNLAPNQDYRWGLSHFDTHSVDQLRADENLLGLIEWLDEEEDEQLAVDPEAWIDLDVPASHPELGDRETRDAVRVHLEEAVAGARGDWLTDQGFDARDRPGPTPAWLEETIARDLADVVQLSDTGPGCFVLPPPPELETRPGETKWDRRAAQMIASQARHGPWFRARFRGPVVIDVALRGTAGRRNDVDNVAHTLLRATRLALGNDLPLMGYRVYRQSWPTNDVRVRLMPKIRLEALAASMDQARALARNERAERARD
jgi:hypothetical protein